MAKSALQYVSPCHAAVSDWPFVSGDAINAWMIKVAVIGTGGIANSVRDGRANRASDKTLPETAPKHLLCPVVQHNPRSVQQSLFAWRRSYYEGL
jgi:hypothetical protein